MSVENEEQEEVRSSLLDALLDNFIRIQTRFQISLPREMLKIHQQVVEFNAEGLAGSHKKLVFPFFCASSIMANRQSMTMSELGEAMEAPLSTTTGLVDWLVEIGYVRRLPDPEDRRVVRISLTEKGRQTQQVFSGHIKSSLKRFMSRLTVDDLKTLVTISTKFGLE